MTTRKPSTLRPVVYGYKDLMAITGLGRETVKACIRTGSLPGYLAGRTYVVPVEAFEAFKRGEWVPQHRPIFSEQITAKPQMLHQKERSA